MKDQFSRRNFLLKSMISGIGLTAAGPLSAMLKNDQKALKFGLVTYLWGKDWDLPTLIRNCEDAGYSGVELRTEHAHAVEINLNAAQRAEVRKRFADSKVTCIGYGSNFEYHSPDAAELKKNLELTKEYIKLCKDIGASGIKIKPNTLPKEVSPEKTIAQIASSFNEIGKFAKDYGQLVRVEIHGVLTQEIPNIRAIFGQVTEKNVKMCWNCNETDTKDAGLKANFNSVKKWIGDTVHIHELNIGTYPYPELFKLLAQMDYKGWYLLEASSKQDDKLTAMKEQRMLFTQKMRAAQEAD